MNYGSVALLLEPLRPMKYFHGNDVAEVRDANVSALIEHHFNTSSIPNHLNRPSLQRALSLLDGKPARILETGSSAWGANSSRLFDRYVRSFGGEFVTIDIRAAASRALKPDVSPKTELIVGDSIRVLQSLIDRGDKPYDFIYLDSFDLDQDNPLRAMLHGMGEFLLLPQLTKVGTIVVIDDTPANWEEFIKAGAHPGQDFASPFGDLVPGKGSLVRRFLDRTAFEIVANDYQLTLRRTI